MQRREWQSARQKDFKEGESAVERVLRYLRRVRKMPIRGISSSLADRTYTRPSVEPHGEPHSGIQRSPEHDRDQEGEGRYSGIEKRVEGLQRARPSLQPGSAGARIGECVQAAEEEVEG